MAIQATADQLIIRKANSEDASQIIEGFIRTYGSSYPNPQMYKREVVEELINTGLMNSVIAVAPSGSVVGHCALSYEHASDCIPEAGKLFVDPDYRGIHLSDRLAQERIKQAKDLNILRFWAACVTNHPYSQHEIISQGGVETGLLINGQPKSVHMDGLQNVEDSRHSLIPCYVVLQACHELLIYLPKKHKAFFEDLLKHTKLKRSIVDDDEQISGTSKMSLHHSPEGKPSFIKVEEIGTDLLMKAELFMQELATEKHPVVYIDIPLSMSGAKQAIQELESLGFFWGAWLPNYTKAGDIVRLQCLLDRTVNEKSIICARQDGEFIRDYVLSEWHRIAS